MLRTDKPIYKVILILNLLLIVTGIVLCIIRIASPDANATTIINRVLAIAVLVFGGFYIVKGYTKGAAKYYKLFGLIYALKLISHILTSITNPGMTFANVCNIVSLVIVLVLLLVKNLKKTKSLILCGILVVVNVVMLLNTIISGDYLAITIMNHIVNLDLACLYGTLTYAKYLDKTERGTK